jgi:hypothetical protein
VVSPLEKTRLCESLVPLRANPNSAPILMRARRWLSEHMPPVVSHEGWDRDMQPGYHVSKAREFGGNDIDSYMTLVV